MDEQNFRVLPGKPMVSDFRMYNPVSGGYSRLCECHVPGGPFGVTQHARGLRHMVKYHIFLNDRMKQRLLRIESCDDYLLACRSITKYPPIIKDIKARLLDHILDPSIPHLEDLPRLSTLQRHENRATELFVFSCVSH